MIKIHSWVSTPPAATKGWCSENNAVPCTGRALLSSSVLFSNITTTNGTTTTSQARQQQEEQEHQQQRWLKAKTPDYCDGFQLQFAIDGKITTWDKTTVLNNIKNSQRVVEFITLLDDDDKQWINTPKSNVELAIRIRGCGRTKPYALTHLYWI